MNVLAALWRLPSRLAVLLVRGYQVLISPMLPPACRFTPSCSHYACACLHELGFLRGSWLTLRRLSRCHPWHPGGYDPPPLGSRLDSNMPCTTPSHPTELAQETRP